MLKDEYLLISYTGSSIFVFIRKKSIHYRGEEQFPSILVDFVKKYAVFLWEMASIRRGEAKSSLFHIAKIEQMINYIKPIKM